MSMQAQLSAEEENRVEDSLRRAIKLNPSFAPSYDRLAVFLGSRHRSLEEAHMMGLKAITLDPSNVGYRMNVANVLMEMEQSQAAVMVLQAAAKLAKTPQESQWIDNALMHAKEFQTQRERLKAEEKFMNEQDKTEPAVRSPTAGSADTARPRLVHREFVPAGPHRFVTGVIQDVHCDSETMDLAVNAVGKTISLHSDNYYKISFSALGFQPSSDLKPCSDLEGRPAKVEYQVSVDKSVTAHLLSIELHK